jgi:biopolymer transport protein ExbD
MAMSVGRTGDSEVMVEINTTPLIDVMLVLLIMLIITIPIQTHAVKLDTPQPIDDPNPPEPPQVFLVEIDFDGTILLDGRVLPSIDALRPVFKSFKNIEPTPELHIKPNRLAKYERVAQVLALAQRTRVEKLGVVGNEQYMQ